MTYMPPTAAVGDRAEIAALRRDLHETQQKLHECEERFGGLFATATIGIAITTPYGSYLQANAVYCRMLGYTVDEMRRLNFASLTHPDDLARNLRWRDELLAGQRENFFMEKRYLKKGGDIVWASLGVSATRAPGETSPRSW